MKIRTRIIAGAASFIFFFSAFGMMPSGGAVTTVCAASKTEVSNFKCTPYSDYVYLYWDAVSSAKSYKVEIKSGSNDYQKAVCKLSKTADGRIKAKITELKSGKKYTVRVTPVLTKNGKSSYGKSKAVVITTKSDVSFESIPMPNKVSKKFTVLANEEDDENYAHYYELTTDKNTAKGSAKYKEAAVSAYNYYLDYLRKKGYTCDLISEENAYDMKDKFYAGVCLNNVTVASFMMGYNSKNEVWYCLVEKKPGTIKLNVKNRVPHPDEYNMDVFTGGDSVYFSNVMTYVYKCGSRSCINDFISKLEENGFKCEFTVDKSGNRMYDVSYKNSHAGTLGYSEDKGVYSLLISYKM